MDARAKSAPAIKNASNIAANNFLCDHCAVCETGPFMTDDALKQRGPMRTEHLDFQLLPELIAQTPPENRGESRLLHYARTTREIHHRKFSDLPSILHPGDVMVFNDSKVIPARFYLRKQTGGKVEALFLQQIEPRKWLVLLKDLGNSDPVLTLPLPGSTKADEEGGLPVGILERRGGGEFVIGLSQAIPAVELLLQIGRMPLPPYIRREKQSDERDEMDRQRYQTVYAHQPGAVAAPTAGLHFTPEILQRVDEMGIERVMVTLHVGAGTFKPILSDTLGGHAMHSESYAISSEAAQTLNRAKKENRRIVAVGTTSARVLESQPDDRPIAAGADNTNIFIYPPYRWKHVDALITNFHLPRSTLIALVAAMTGLDEQRRIYREAITEKYRFFSYGDAMLLE
jgi:S-adenosylmethionine:tRNA ribosyltransferase-isomerase